MVTSIGAGTVADVTEPAKRASRIGLFLLGPQLGPLLGPLIGGQFSHESTWRWVFGFLCTTLSFVGKLTGAPLIFDSCGLLASVCSDFILPTRDTTVLGWQR
jgi:MFS family permease